MHLQFTYFEGRRMLSKNGVYLKLNRERFALHQKAKDLVKSQKSMTKFMSKSM